jgi:hypothetical protein
MLVFLTQPMFCGDEKFVDETSLPLFNLLMNACGIHLSLVRICTDCSVPRSTKVLNIPATQDSCSKELASIYSNGLNENDFICEYQQSEHIISQCVNQLQMATTSLKYESIWFDNLQSAVPTMKLP